MLNKTYIRRKFPFLIPVTLLFFMASFNSCEEDEDSELSGNWIERSDFEGVARADAVAFTIGDKAYVATGYDGTDRLDDMWEYDPERNNWVQKASFPGGGRNGAVAFSDGEYGYVGLGYDGINKLKDFWRYDPDADEWLQISDFGGSARYGAVAFSIGNKGYVGTGYDGNYLKDIWEYDPDFNSWTQKVSIGGSKRRDAIAFTINGKGYICTGIDNGAYEDDFWEYDPTLDLWTEKRDIANISDEDYDDYYSGLTGIYKVGFSLNGKGYMATGGQGSTGQAVWEYDPITDLWEQKTSFEGTARIDAVAFTINDRAFVTTGRSSSYYFDDIWEFLPDDDYDEYD